MEVTSRDDVSVYVDPCCPFAWITCQWLTEVEQRARIRLDVRLLSLAVVNEHRTLDDWYRGFNDRAWGPARVMAAVTERHGGAAARRFYEAFGVRFHVQLGTGDDADRGAVTDAALAAARLPAALIGAADDARWDERLRAVTGAALERVGLDVGVPVVEIAGVVASGPVLTTIPRGDEAVVLYDAVRALGRQPGFVRLERRRVGELETA
jgi:hypothetical protein